MAGREKEKCHMDWRQIAAAWGEFFIGCPRRTLAIVTVGVGLFLILNPAILVALLGYLMREVVSPLLGVMIPAAIVWWIGRKFWHTVAPPKGKKK